MSLCITALTPSGIILTADSRTTYRNSAGMTRIGTDNAIKLFRLAEKSAVVIAGRALFPDSKGVIKTTGWFIEDFRAKELDNLPKMSVKEIAAKLNEYLIQQYIVPEELRVKALLQAEVLSEGGNNLVFHGRQGLQINYSFEKQGKPENRQFFLDPMSFIVAGYDSDGLGRAQFINVPFPADVGCSRDTQNGGMLRIGQDDVVTRIMNGWSNEIFELPLVQYAQQNKVDVLSEFQKLMYITNWGIMTLQDAIDLCVLLTRVTESIQRFSDGTHFRPGGITGVGGAVDVAKITPDGGFEWLRQKSLKVDDAP